MNVASLELCRELYAVSGWKEPGAHRFQLGMKTSGAVPTVPYYTLGYLLRKLPQNAGRITLKHREHSGQWFCKFDVHTEEIGKSADTPEDAAALLAIELFNQKLLDRLEHE